MKGYPTVKFFVKGVRESIKYPSSRTEEAMIAWINEQVEKSVPQEVKEEATPEELWFIDNLNL